jgi:hypothetical protein
VLLISSHSGNEIVEYNTGGDVARNDRRQMFTEVWWENLPTKRTLGSHKCIWQDNIKIAISLRTKMGS